MAGIHYDRGFAVGRSGQVGRPPYDPRDPLTMIFVNDFNRGFDDGEIARLLASTRPHNEVIPPALPRKERPL